jgi:hypothetical protein
MERSMCLNHALYSDCLGYSSDNVVLQVTGLDVMRVPSYQRHVLAFLIFQTDLPSVEELWSGLYVLQLWILEWSLELPTNNIFKTVVRDDMMVSALVLDGNSLLHQAAFFEFVAVDERPTEATLLVWR